MRQSISSLIGRSLPPPVQAIKAWANDGGIRSGVPGALLMGLDTKVGTSNPAATWPKSHARGRSSGVLRTTAPAAFGDASQAEPWDRLAPP